MTGTYLLALSFLTAVLLYGAMRLVDFSRLLAVVSAATVPLTAVVDMHVLGRENWDTQHDVLAFEARRIGIIIAVVLMMVAFCFVAVSPQQAFVDKKVLPVGAAGLFWIPLWWLLSLNYQSDHSYYVNEYSEYFDLWEAASVSMERGRKAKQNDNLYGAYYHYRKAQTWYDELSKKAERDEYRAAATGYSRAAQNFKFSVAAESYREAKQYVDIGGDYLDEVNDVLRHRVCDECNKKYKVQYVYRTTTPEGLEEAIYCEDCFHSIGQHHNPYDETTSSSRSESSTGSTKSRGQSNQTRQNDRSQNKQERRRRSEKAAGSRTDNKQSESTSGSDRAVDDSRTKQSSKAAREYTDDDTVTVQWACDILEIEKPVDSDKVKNAFRKQVKESHPDAGGSPQDFKKVKQARDRLERHIESN